MSEVEIRPFANGAQFVDWQDANCCRCKKYSFQRDPATGKTRKPLGEHEVCPIELALHRSAWGDGMVSPDIAQRMGFSDPLAYSWPCGEVEWTEEWKVEFLKRRAEFLKRRAELPEPRP